MDAIALSTPAIAPTPTAIEKCDYTSYISGLRKPSSACQSIEPQETIFIDLRSI
jgi:hypothetical protein